MNIRISESPKGGWTLWVTDKPGDTEPPIYTAQGRTQDQILAILPVILAEEGAKVDAYPAAKRHALLTVLTTLDGWIKGARENHTALDHHHESRGAECWRSFGAGDIRAIVNDAARELGVAVFPPQKIPPEDTP